MPKFVFLGNRFPVPGLEKAVRRLRGQRPVRRVLVRPHLEDRRGSGVQVRDASRRGRPVRQLQSEDQEMERTHQGFAGQGRFVSDCRMLKSFGG